MHALPRIAEQDRASGYVMEALMAAIAGGGEEAKARVKAFLEKRGPKVARLAEPDVAVGADHHDVGIWRPFAAGAARPARFHRRSQSDGTIYCARRIRSLAYPDKLTERLVHWAHAHA